MQAAFSRLGLQVSSEEVGMLMELCLSRAAATAGGAKKQPQQKPQQSMKVSATGVAFLMELCLSRAAAAGGAKKPMQSLKVRVIVLMPCWPWMGEGWSNTYLQVH